MCETNESWMIFSDCIIAGDTRTASRYRCVLCGAFGLEMYQLPQRACEHLFCKVCIKKGEDAVFCPFDKKEISREYSIPVKCVPNNDILCRCPAKGFGCLWVGTITDFYQEHWKKCYFINGDELEIKKEKIEEPNEKFEETTSENGEIDDVEIKEEQIFFCGTEDRKRHRSGNENKSTPITKEKKIYKTGKSIIKEKHNNKISSKGMSKKLLAKNTQNKLLEEFQKGEETIVLID